jgi:hypothetical protein
MPKLGMDPRRGEKLNTPHRWSPCWLLVGLVLGACLTVTPVDVLQQTTTPAICRRRRRRTLRPPTKHKHLQGTVARQEPRTSRTI